MRWVRAEFVSAEKGARAWSPGSPYTEFVASIRYTFRVLEYLKGSGASTITVEVHVFDETIWLSRAHAIPEAEFWIEANARWHDRQMILMLADAKSSDPWDYQFAGPEYVDVTRYTIDSEENKAWLPAADAPDAVSGAANGDDLLFLTDAPSETSGVVGAALATISLGEIRNRITAVDQMIADYHNPEAALECVRRELSIPRSESYFAALPVRTIEFELASGTSCRNCFQFLFRSQPRRLALS